MNKLGRSVIAALLVAGAFALAGCGQQDTTTSASGGQPGVLGPPVPPVPPAPVVPPPPFAGVPTLVLTLANQITGGVTTSVPATARAIVRDAAGVGVPSVVVTFTTDPTFGAFVPPSGTALTDATGTATVGLNAANFSSAGAATLTASSSVLGTPVTGSIGYSIGAINVTITNFTFGFNPLSAFGTTSVSVTINSNGVPVTSPQTVSFSSPCASSGKAVLTASVLTGAGGVATASYRDVGCGAPDLVTASVSGIANASLTLNVTAPTTGSIQFISAIPASITLKGTGGAGRQESSQVIFKVVDTGGNPIGGVSVNFSLSTSIGGITFANGLTTSTATSDATTGQAVVTVNSGTVATPVRVLATAGALSALSDQLTITTGIPDQASFSVAATTLNIEGLNHDGITTVLTARLADHFSNPVPDGTAVNFIAEGGSIGNNGLGSCITANGACSATLTSQALRPNNGRVTVLAFAVGEESFTDTNGNGFADPGELFDANTVSTDMGEAFLDYNENGVRDANEPFLDFNKNGIFDGPDGLYSGVLCNPAAGAFCSAQRSIHARKDIVIVFSGSGAVITVSPSPIDLGGCGPVQTVSIHVRDVNGNPMPAGSIISVTTSNGTLSGATTFAQLNTSAPQPVPNYFVSIQGDGTLSGTPVVCTDKTTSGALTVTVTTPLGIITTSNTTVMN